MEKIASFTVDHLRLMPGLYVSRVDMVNQNPITTFDMRVTRPNFEDVLDTKSIHAYEHLGATFLRNNKEYKERIIYFGPMGCRTGFYIVIAGKYNSWDVVGLIKEMNDFVMNYEGEVPGANPKDCGNYLDISLEGAIKIAVKYQKDFLSKINKDNLEYPK